MTANKFSIDQIVYLNIPDSDYVGRVTALVKYKDHIEYLVTWNDMVSRQHTIDELTLEKRIV